jgi:GntR family transcriptional repressor for pyruvate dehydrogenase complex
MTSAFEPVKRVALTDAVVEQIYDQMISGRLKPGDRLPSETELSSVLTVGRSTIREALRVLSALGLVARTRRGTFVSESGSSKIVETLTRGRLVLQAQLKDLLEVRRTLELTTAYLAAQRCTDDDLEKLRQAYAAMVAGVGDPANFVQSDADFHLAVAEAAENDVLLKVLGVVRELLLEAMATIMAADPSIQERAIGYHGRILRAIENGSPEEARTAMADHLDDVWKTTEASARQKAV